MMIEIALFVVMPVIFATIIIPYLFAIECADYYSDDTPIWSDEIEYSRTDTRTDARADASADISFAR